MHRMGSSGPPILPSPAHGDAARPIRRIIGLAAAAHRRGQGRRRAGTHDQANGSQMAGHVVPVSAAWPPALSACSSGVERTGAGTRGLAAGARGAGRRPQVPARDRGRRRGDPALCRRLHFAAAQGEDARSGTSIRPRSPGATSSSTRSTATRSRCGRSIEAVVAHPQGVDPGDAGAGAPLHEAVLDQQRRPTTTSRRRSSCCRSTPAAFAAAVKTAVKAAPW